MKKLCMAFAILCSGLTSHFASAGEVKITWQAPDDYADIRPTNESREHFREHVFKALGQVFTDLAKKLPDDVMWNVTVTDIDLAGDVRPGIRPTGGDIRIVKDIYWPRMSFTYVMTDTNGTVISEGKEDISDMGFLMTRQLNTGNGDFPYETKMLEDWFRQQQKRQRFPAK